MVAVSQQCAYTAYSKRGMFLCQVHAQLACLNDVCFSGLVVDVFLADVTASAGLLHNLVNGDIALVDCRFAVLENALGELKVNDLLIIYD